MVARGSPPRLSGGSSNWFERRSDKAKVVGSNPTLPTTERGRGRPGHPDEARVNNPVDYALMVQRPNMPACRAGERGFESRWERHIARYGRAQSTCQCGGNRQTRRPQKPLPRGAGVRVSHLAPSAPARPATREVAGVRRRSLFPPHMSPRGVRAVQVSSNG